VAVTSNRGTGRAPLRPGANPQLEWQYYQNKTQKGKAGTDELFDIIVLLWTTSGFAFGIIVLEMKVEFQ
jgi:hypothetical protein